ncbi:GntR family transcriptional regulator [Bailinhaonella thermotolerans]|uniref:GntR family transcriptional regulator n=1 Tax=Bailinhaonella thermotolerans TaxID=1070861 RepID=A0A3A4BT81_9ACTN|nr:GntR family transcriptional regulator [Bailinhaonella thermotolerans]RJL34516.1 GntR family transcriptional regulator [Bailinhaonella thermotolerans]
MGALVRAPLREQIRQMLLDGLISGRWQPGDRIVERRVAAELEVSQAPVREALRDLEALRIVESSPNKGARVREITEADLREVYEVRAGLEETAARLALGRVPIDALERHVARLHEAARHGDAFAQVPHLIAFHREIVRASGNEILLSVWESLGFEVWTHLSIRLFRATPHENADDHEPIVEAFRRQDPGIGLLIRDHVLSYTR